ncbi:oligosaccharide flippase family protein [Pseudomonas sp. B392_1p]|uniref:oligosaccharide flippase family protein n=1 Tax=Pseudomonas sp. B392_1p TaxID=3457507 RepID=UPI003FD3CE53
MRFNASVINGLSLMAIQGANALFPLLVFPFLLGMLGKESFAELVVAEALAFYVLTVCLYSFDTSGVQLIIEARKQAGSLAEATCLFNILGARIALFLVSALPLAGIYHLFADGSVAVLLVWLCFVLGMIFQCNYYFQAIESNWLLAVFVLFSRCCAVLAVYLLVDGKADLMLASMILAGSYLFSGIAALTTLLSRFGLRGVRSATAKAMFSMLSEGRHLFLGNVSVTLFRGANILILAGVSSSAAVSAYALAEKVIKSIQALARPLSQLFMPKALKAWSLLSIERKTKLQAFNLIWKNTRIQVYLMLVVLPVGVLLIYLGQNFGLMPGFNGDVTMLIALMAPAVIFGVANSMFGVVGLSMIGEQSYYASAVLMVGVLIFCFSLVVSHFFAAFGAATSYVLAEMLLLMSFISRYQWKFVRG